MPYKCEKLKLLPHQDRRKKLTDQEREEIKKLYGKISQRKLAKRYEVSRSTIIFIGDPEKLKRNIRRRKERGGSKIYYDKEKHTKAMRKHRRYKQDLYINGELESTPSKQ